MKIIILTAAFILFVLVLIKYFSNKKKEAFTNFLSVADDRDLYVRYLDYLHEGYKMNKEFVIYDIYGVPHLINKYSNPYIISQSNPNFKGHFFQMPHDLKIIKL